MVECSTTVASELVDLKLAMSETKFIIEGNIDDTPPRFSDSLLWLNVGDGAF